MAINIWGSWGAHWSEYAKVEFDGSNKLIIVHPEVTQLDIRADVYTEWVNWLRTSDDNLKWSFAIRYSGLDPIPGGESGGIFFLYNGWKLIIDFNKVAVTGVLFSDDYPSAYWSKEGQPLYPAQVSSVVSSVIQQQLVTVQANPADIANEILATPVTGTMQSGSLGEFIVKRLLTVAKFLGLK